MTKKKHQQNQSIRQVVRDRVTEKFINTMESKGKRSKKKVGRWLVVDWLSWLVSWSVGYILLVGWLTDCLVGCLVVWFID